MAISEFQAGRKIFETVIAGFLERRSGVVLIEGPAGHGKSALLRQTENAAASLGALVLSGVCSAAERGTPLGALRQLLAGVREGLPAGFPALGPQAPAGVHEFCAQIDALSRQRPVVLCVDDVHHADEASLQYLGTLAHGAREQVLLVVTRSPYFDRSYPASLDGVSPGGGVERITLKQMDVEEVDSLLRRQSGLARHGATPQELRDAVGGNPLLVRTLVDELHDRDPVAPADPVSGARFARAVLTCLRRSGHAANDVACAYAVLQSGPPPEDVAQLLALPVTTVTQALAALRASGIFAGLRYRHPRLARLVLEGMDPVAQARLHRRYAALLHRTGAPIAEVVRHLETSHTSDESWTDLPWAADLLWEHAERLIGGEQHREAARYLELARAACQDPGLRAAIDLRFAAITWRFAPDTAERHLAVPLRMVEEGGLSTGRMDVLARLLRAQGRISEARHVSARLAGQLGDVDGAFDIAARHGGAVLWDMPEQTGADLAAHEHFLADSTLSEGTVLSIVRALRALTLSDRLDQVPVWCARLSEAAMQRDAPGWVSLFATLHGEALLRLGDLPGAERCGLQAKGALSDGCRSVLAGAAHTLLIGTRTAMGRHGDVAQMLDTLAPELLCDTVFRPGYLYAHGQHLMALGQAAAALHEFLDAGRLLTAWAMDRPLALPWRTDAAEALLRLGETQQAERLIEQQLALPDGRHPRLRGEALRLRAAMAATPEQGQTLLEQAVEELRRGGNRLQQAKAMTDLGRLLQSQGDAGSAGSLNRRAWNVAQACGAQGLQEEILPGLTVAPQAGTLVPRQAQHDDRGGKLSESEQRVATLAAQGYTNREISTQLWVTVSTVEQHLTRVYRKLSISRRQDLPADLQLKCVEGA
ncbi:helix-turn-helix transcriptional regulator [Streptomyces sp. NBC_00328]|uniref:helix-turn-helix transcriptional regulator n=1 Tax=Streptomyces sp. NBC_00328 TaxID=2903646 RepID=UPI002E292498|nr:AAA family ATPase [Streptomyces sp. NBC_00328]